MAIPKRVAAGDTVELHVALPTSKDPLHLDHYVFYERRTDGGAWKLEYWASLSAHNDATGKAQALRSISTFRRPAPTSDVATGSLPSRFLAPDVKKDTTFRACVQLIGRSGGEGSTVVTFTVTK